MKNEIQIYLTKEWLLKRIAVEHNITTGLLKIKKNIVQWNWCKNISFLKIIGECPVTAFNEIKNILSTIDHNPKAIQDIIDCYAINTFPNVTQRTDLRVRCINWICYVQIFLLVKEWILENILGETSKTWRIVKLIIMVCVFIFIKYSSFPSILFLPEICLRSFLAQPAFGKECKDTFSNPASIYLFKVTIKTLQKGLTYVQSYQWQYQKDVLRYFGVFIVNLEPFQIFP